MENEVQTPPPPASQGNDEGNNDDNGSSRKRRGRPPGAKNKVKQPVIIYREKPNSLTSHIFEISPNHDIVRALSDFAAKRHRGICILSATGTVMNVVFRQPPTTHPNLINRGGVVSFAGMFEILSMSGAFLPVPAPPSACGISVHLSGGQGHVVGGKVVGPLVAAGNVVVVAASFVTSLYENLPLIGEERAENIIRAHENAAAVTVAVPGTVRHVPILQISQQTVNQQQVMMAATTASASASTSGGGGVLNGFDGSAENNNEDAVAVEDLWGSTLPDRSAPF